jgi:sugar O-acyltransferase (sialic acid O-acetyltransferase NeuD family)
LSVGRSEVVIVGAGGHAREVIDVIEAMNGLEPRFDIVGYIVEPGRARTGENVNGYPVLGGLDWFVGRAAAVRAICAVGAPELRHRLAERVAQLGVSFFNAIHPDAKMTQWVTLGDGVVVAAGCVLTNQIQLGNHVHINIGCTLSHNTKLEDFATLAPGVHAAGGVVFREGCNIGVGASFIPRVEVGAWSVVGAGAVVIHDVPRDSTVVGVPARVSSTREPNWHLT